MGDFAVIIWTNNSKITAEILRLRLYSFSERITNLTFDRIEMKQKSSFMLKTII